MIVVAQEWSLRFRNAMPASVTAISLRSSSCKLGKVVTQQWETKAINLRAAGRRNFWVEEYDLATWSKTGTVYASD